MSFSQRLDQIVSLAEVIGKNREAIVDLAVKELRFTVKDSRTEVDLVQENLRRFQETEGLLAARAPLGGTGSSVSLMLSYNGSAWLNTTITSIFLVGNRVRVKFSSKGRKLMELTESMYRPIFGDAITFYGGSGRSFIEQSLEDPEVSTVVVFGFDENILPYAEAFRSSGKKLVFEGPGSDPFIVFPDADLELALSDLMAGKFMYSGQTCTAPKRIFIHESI